MGQRHRLGENMKKTSILCFFIIFFSGVSVATTITDDTYKIPISYEGVTVGVDVAWSDFGNEKNYTIEYGEKNTIGQSVLSNRKVRTTRLSDTRFISVWVNATNKMLGVVGNIDPSDKTITYGTIVNLGYATGLYPFVDVHGMNETFAMLQFEWDASPQYYYKFGIIRVTGTDTLNSGTYWNYAVGGIFKYPFYHNCFNWTFVDYWEEQAHFEFATTYSTGMITYYTRVVPGYVNLADKSTYRVYFGTAQNVHSTSAGYPFALKCLRVYQGDEYEPLWNCSIFYNITGTSSYDKNFHVAYSLGTTYTHTFYNAVAVNKSIVEGYLDVFSENEIMLYYRNVSSSKVGYRIGNMNDKNFTFTSYTLLDSDSGHLYLALSILQDDKAIASFGYRTTIDTKGYGHYGWKNPGDTVYWTRRFEATSTTMNYLQTVKLNATWFLNGYVSSNTPNHIVAEITKYTTIDFYSNSSGSWALWDSQNITENQTVWSTNNDFDTPDTWYYWNATITNYDGATEVIKHFFAIDKTQITLVENIDNATGEHEYIWNETGYWVWANYTGLNQVDLYENIVGASGTHEKQWTGTKWKVWANYTGVGGGSAFYGDFNLSVRDPNPGAGNMNVNTTVSDGMGINVSALVKFNPLVNRANVTFSSNSSGSWVVFYSKQITSNQTVWFFNKNFSASNTSYWWNVSANYSYGGQRFFMNRTFMFARLNASVSGISIIPIGSMQIATMVIPLSSMALMGGLLGVRRRRKRIQ